MKTTDQTDRQTLTEAIIVVLSDEATPTELHNSLADSLSDLLNESQLFDLTPENLRDWLPRALAKREQSKAPSTADPSQPDETKHLFAGWQQTANKLAEILEDETLPSGVRSILGTALDEISNQFGDGLSSADIVRRDFAVACAAAAAQERAVESLSAGRGDK